MANFWEDDINILFSDFAVTATHGKSSFDVIFFFESGRTMDIDISPGLEAYRFVAEVKASDASSLNRGDTISINSTNYCIKEKLSTDIGTVKLYLAEVGA